MEKLKQDIINRYEFHKEQYYKAVLSDDHAQALKEQGALTALMDLMISNKIEGHSGVVRGKHPKPEGVTIEVSPSAKKKYPKQY